MPNLMTMTTMRAEQVRLSYGATPVVDGLSLTLPTGQVTAIVGPNGSGKSTLLRALARLHALDAGQVVLTDNADTEDLRALAPKDFARRLAMLTQARPTPSGLTVADVVEFGRHPHRRGLFGVDAEGAAAVARALEITALTDLAHRGVDTLSGGQLQRVWLASCLAQDTPVLLLDEPTNHLDLRHQMELLDLVRDLADDHGVTLGVVLHDLNQAAAVADQVVLLADGTVVAAGDPHVVLTDERLTRAYGVQVDVRTDGDDLRITALMRRQCRRPSPLCTHIREGSPCDCAHFS